MFTALHVSYLNNVTYRTFCFKIVINHLLYNKYQLLKIYQLANNSTKKICKSVTLILGLQFKTMSTSFTIHYLYVGYCYELEQIDEFSGSVFSNSNEATWTTIESFFCQRQTLRINYTTKNYY